ncbi:MAG TPA: MerR family DNA-binding transcriptional regulator [Methanomassiliicoccales archaeon]|nr:MerR family DNA-binding transcriptional regulator [Methanomassiliicoccales archaeon]
MTEARELLSIGDLSIITRLSMKALRFYDEKGLLVPVRKEITGYRCPPHTCPCPDERRPAELNLNDPKSTPEDDLLTEVQVPVV